MKCNVALHGHDFHGVGRGHVVSLVDEILRGAKPVDLINATRPQSKRVIDGPDSDSNGLRLIEAFMRIDNAALRRRIVMLVQEIAGDDGN